MAPERSMRSALVLVLVRGELSAVVFATAMLVYEVTAGLSPRCDPISIVCTAVFALPFCAGATTGSTHVANRIAAKGTSRKR